MAVHKEDDVTYNQRCERRRDDLDGTLMKTAYTVKMIHCVRVLQWAGPEFKHPSTAASAVLRIKVSNCAAKERAAPT